MFFAEFTGQRWAGYGCVLSNTKKNPEDTICYEELQQNFGLDPDDIYIDIVMANVKKRPVLDNLLDQLDRHDRIYISDINDLLGTTNKARDYYRKALQKEVELFIMDCNHTLFHIHKMSFLIPKIEPPIKINVDELLKRFDTYVKEEHIQAKQSASGRRKCYLNQFNASWKRLYFDYESYQIDLETAIQKAGEFGIKNYPTFINMVKDYERSLDYHDDTIEYAKQDPDFIYLPKRIIKRANGSYEFPEEYHCIKREIEEKHLNIEINSSNFHEEGFISRTGINNGFLINNVIYKRYQNLETMKIPRKLREVDIHYEEM